MNLSVDHNPYESIYRQEIPLLGKQTNRDDVEHLVRHLGQIYNTFGIVMKDFIKVVAHKFE